MRVREKRQRHMVGDDDMVTGVRVWPLLVPGIKCDPTMAGLLVKVDTKEEDEGEEDMDEEEAEEVAVACASDLGMLVDQYMGWRTSYRRGRPEDYHEGEARVRRVLKSKAKHLAKARAAMGRTAKRHRPVGKPDTRTKKAHEIRRRLALKTKRH